jgi:hypothetical protein
MSQQKCPYNTRWQLSLDYHQGCSEMQKHIDAALVPGLKSFCEQLQAEPSLEAIRPACLDQSLNTCLAEIVSSARLTPHSRPQDRFSGRPGDSLQEYKAWVKGELEKFFDQNKGDPVLIAVRGLLAAKLQIPVPSN